MPGGATTSESDVSRLGHGTRIRDAVPEPEETVLQLCPFTASLIIDEKLSRRDSF